MEKRELLYSLEYKVNELREQYIKEVKYAKNLTLREVMSMGFDNNYLRINGDYIYLGYISYYTYNDKETIEYNGDFGELTEEQLNCKVKYYDYETNECNYTDITLELANKEDEKLFTEGE